MPPPSSSPPLVVIVVVVAAAAAATRHRAAGDAEEVDAVVVIVVPQIDREARGVDSAWNAIDDRGGVAGRRGDGLVIVCAPSKDEKIIASAS